MVVADMMMQSQGVMKSLDLQMEQMESARDKHARAKIQFERTKGDFVRFGAARTFQLSMEERFQNLTDPRTGKANADFSKMAIEAALSEDPQYKQKELAFEDARDEYYRAEVGLMDLSEKLGVTKTKARLLAAMMILMSEKTDGEEEA